MAENEHSGTQGDLNQSPSNVPSIIQDNADHPGSENKERKNEKEDSKKEGYKHPEVTVNIPEQDNEAGNAIAREANTISRNANNWTAINIIISTALFVITLVTFLLTKRSVDISDIALKQSIKKDYYDSLNRRHSDSTDSVSRVSDYAIRKSERDSSYAVANRSLDAQIRSLKNTQKRFEIENKPILQIQINSTLDTTNGIMTPEVEVHNLNKYPVKVTKAGIIGGARIVQPVDTSHGFMEFGVEQIISQSYPLKVILANDNGGWISRPLLEDIRISKRWYYFYGYVNYTNLITEEVGRYVFMFKFNPITNLGYYIYNENYTAAIRKKRR